MPRSGSAAARTPERGNGPTHARRNILGQSAPESERNAKDKRERRPTKVRADVGAEGSGGGKHAALMTRAEVARYLSVSERTVWAVTTSGALRHVRIGRAVRYRRGDVDHYVERHARGGR